MSRSRISINDNWKFIRGDQPFPGYKAVDDGDWRSVTIPHDWSVEEDFCESYSSGTGYLANGIGWYRKRFSLPAEYHGKRVFITFEGVYNNSQVWCNSYYINRRPYGYSTFTYDITEFVQFGSEENVVAVKVSHNDSADSRWFTGSGVYRNVFLTVTEPLHFEENGVFVSTVESDDHSAKLRVGVQICGVSGEEITPDVRVILNDVHGKTCGECSQPIAGNKGTLHLTVDSPELWSPDSPYLYDLTVQLLNAGDIVDEVTVKTGIRTFMFDPKQGFSLNGDNMKMKGVCLHHDAGCLGAAVPKEVWRRRLSDLKEMGCNAIRCSHNPPAPDFLDLCDEIGFLVQDEAFDEWEGVKNKWWQGHNVYPPKHFGYYEDFPEWHRRDLQDMVSRDRNHPSVIFWSIGNEIDYPNDPYCHPSFAEMVGNNDSKKPAAERVYDPAKPNAERLVVIARELVELVKECDPTRPVTAALAFPELSCKTGLADTLDIVGYNYKEHLYADDTETWPDRVIYGSENGKRLREWEYVRDNDNICAQFLWTGIDYLGEAAGWPVRAAAAGLLDLAGYRKASWYFRKSLWSDSPFVQLSTVLDGEKEAYGSEKFHWNFEHGEHIVISAYSNCEQVELFVNGTSHGAKVLKDEQQLRASWTVPFEPGVIEAVAVDSGGGRHTSRIETAGEVDAIRAQLYMADSGESSCREIDISLADAEGRAVTHVDKIIHVSIDGTASLMGLENGNVADLTPYHLSNRSTYRGRLKGYFRSGSEGSRVTLKADEIGEVVIDL